MQKQKTSLLPLILKEYRRTYDIKQEQLATELHIDVRTLRRYENGETPLTDIEELHRIADVLGIEPEQLGILPRIETPEQVGAAVDRIWSLLKSARYHQTISMIEPLLHAATSLAKANPDVSILQRLAEVQYVAGYVRNHTTRANETSIPLKYYSELEQTARTLGDDTLLTLALSYEGDMYQRGGRVSTAIDHLEASRDTTTDADRASKGNAIQLLGRAYFKARRYDDFDRAMHEAEELASAISQDTTQVELSSKASSTRGQFGLATVYEEWGKSLGVMGHLNAAMEYLNKAEAQFSLHWTPQRTELLLSSSRAIALVHGGDIEEGQKQAIRCVQLCKKYGNVRTLERIYSVNRYLDEMSLKVRHASTNIREVLEGPVDY